MKIHDVCVNCSEQFKSNLIVREIIIDSTLRSSSTTTITTSARSAPNWKSVRVNKVLSSVYKFGLMDQLPIKKRFYGGSNNIDDDDTEPAVCGDCARVLTNLYHYFEEFSKMRKQQSYISSKINKLNQTWTHLAKGTPLVPQHRDNLPLAIFDDDYDATSGQQDENSSSGNGNGVLMESSLDDDYHEYPLARQRPVKVERETDPDIEIVAIIDITEPRSSASFSVENGHNSVINQNDNDNTMEPHDPLERQNNNNNGFNFEDLPSTNLIEIRNGPANPVEDFYREDDDIDPLAVDAPGDQEDDSNNSDQQDEFEEGRPCTLCNEVYLTSADLAKHLIQAHVKKGNKNCPICAKQCSFGYMKTHLKLHAGYKPFSCPESGCTMTFISSSNLYKHIQSGHQGAKNAGRSRKTSFGPQASKGVPRGTQKNQTSSSTPAAAAATTTTTTTMKRKATPFQSTCSLCPLDHFKNPDELGTHIFRDHIPANSNTCPVCEIHVIHRGPLKLHILRKHAGGFHGDIRTKKSKPSKTVKRKFRTLASKKRKSDHVCPHCPRVCQSESALVMHIRVHTGEKPFKCLDCNYAASRQFTLNIHCRNNNHRPSQE